MFTILSGLFIGIIVGTIITILFQLITIKIASKLLEKHLVKMEDHKTLLINFMNEYRDILNVLDENRINIEKLKKVLNIKKN